VKRRSIINKVQITSYHSIRSQEFDDQVHQLTKELAEVRAKFEKAEVQSREPSPFVLKLQEEMLKIKVIILLCII
jgi:hypothetical protein